MSEGVVINTVDDAPVVPLPGLRGLSATGLVTTRSVIASETALLLWVHELAPGASLRLQSPRCDHLLYVWKGDLHADGIAVGADQAVVVEHNASSTLEAGPCGATIAHFHQSESQPLLSHRAGGHVHIAARDGLFARWDEERHATHTVLVDAHCPSCELWIHRSAFGKARRQSEPHLHNEDEIIFVTEGGTIVGKTHKAGTAIAVAQGTIYAFGVAEGGTTFINFRATNPLVRMTVRGKPVGEWISERSFMLNEAEVPVIDPRAELSRS